MKAPDSEICVHFDSAGDFLDYIRPSKSHWLGGIRGKLRWIFRGQCDSTWGLTPSAWRKDPTTKVQIATLSAVGPDSLVDFDFILDRCRLIVPSRVGEANEQSESELRMLQEFIAHANVAGLAIPHDRVQVDFTSMGFIAKALDFEIKEFGRGFKILTSPFFDHVLKTQKPEINDEVFVQLEAQAETRGFRERWPYFTNFTMRHSVAALAQHHGIPTRLLDWSYDSRKATYFACQGVGNDVRSEKRRRIALFAINPFMIKNRFLTDESLLAHIDDPLSVAVFLSRHSVFFEKTQTTSYILAQEGLFTYPERADLHYLFTGSYPDILTMILKMAEWQVKFRNEAKTAFPVTDYIRKVTLPYSEVDSLLEMLDDERIMLTTLMPSLDRIKTCMLERASRKGRLS